MKYRFWVWLHRYCGLAMAAFLFVVGLTGSLLAFDRELEHFFAPKLFAHPKTGVAPLDLATLAERAQKAVPHGRLVKLAYTDVDQIKASFVPLRDRATGRAYDLGFDEFFIDPWTSEELGRRLRDDLSQWPINAMPFIYDLHCTLIVDPPGEFVLGCVALIWSVDCFIAFYLTLPRGSGEFWRRWKNAWRVKWQASTVRINFDLHRAGGLWLWPMLFVFAWSSVMMNLRPAYEAVMRTVFDYRSPEEILLTQARRNAAPKLDWRAAQGVGERLMAEQSRKLGFQAGQPLVLAYDPETGAYSYHVRGSHDLLERAPGRSDTFVLFDGETGALRQVSQPTGERTGNTIETWLYALHMARVFGRPFQFFVCGLGLITASLSVTGVCIWWRKRKFRGKVSASRSQTPAKRQDQGSCC